MGSASVPEQYKSSDKSKLETPSFLSIRDLNPIRILLLLNGVAQA